ncbi:phosphotransferase enzyme family protein [Actinomadura syzygii]|uniref:Phosphotransferase n=1 Tax=Actinomadura syzygii TaxID=1427538 RepID=A0A5D0TXV3_9ACTN|nr:phosphotransferase [Actinomadura syzygii]
MTYAEIPLTESIRAAIEDGWGREVEGPAERLHGGEESAAYRIGDLLVRVGPEWRSTAMAEWCNAVAEHAASAIPEAVAPFRTRAGTTTVRADGRPVSLWRYVAGEWPDDRDPRMRTQAARTLARLHRALASYRPPPRRETAFAEVGLNGDPPVEAPYLADPDLDRWLADYAEHNPARQVLHGDFYAGNTLAHDGRLVAVLDWDEIFIGPPELEVASAALEWSDEFGDAEQERRRFITDYHQAGGTAGPIDDRTAAQLIRHKLRREAAYFELARERGTEFDQDDIAYHERRVAAFFQLK